MHNVCAQWDHSLQVEHSTIGFPSLLVAPHTQSTLSVSRKTGLVVVGAEAEREVEGAAVVEPAVGGVADVVDSGVEIWWEADRAVGLMTEVPAAGVAETDAVEAAGTGAVEAEARHMPNG